MRSFGACFGMTMMCMKTALNRDAPLPGLNKSRVAKTTRLIHFVLLCLGVQLPTCFDRALSGDSSYNLQND